MEPPSNWRNSSQGRGDKMFRSIWGNGERGTPEQWEYEQIFFHACCNNIWYVFTTAAFYEADVYVLILVATKARRYATQNKSTNNAPD